MKRLKLLISFLLPISLFLAGCGGTESKKSQEDSDKQLTIYTTVYPLQYFTEVIGGNAVHVETVYPPGSDEHTFDPSQKDMMKLAESDLFIYVGLGLEGFVEKAKSTLKDEKVTLLEAGGNIHIEENATTHEDEEHAAKDDHNHGDIDPHVWLDPIYSKELAASIKEALIKQMPENEETLIKITMHWYKN